MTAQANQNPPRQRSDLTLPLVIVLSILLGGAFLVVAVASLAGGIVSAYALLLLRSMLLAALVSLLVYGKGYLRTFCLGAILPVGLQAASGIGSVLLLMPPAAWRRSAFGRLEDNLASRVLIGVLALAAGTVSVVARFLVESLQGARRDEG